MPNLNIALRISIWFILPPLHFTCQECNSNVSRLHSRMYCKYIGWHVLSTKKNRIEYFCCAESRSGDLLAIDWIVSSKGNRTSNFFSWILAVFAIRIQSRILNYTFSFACSKQMSLIKLHHHLKWLLSCMWFLLSVDERVCFVLFLGLIAVIGSWKEKWCQYKSRQLLVNWLLKV